MTSSKPKVLIVDDDSRILELLKQFFAKNEFESYTALDAQGAIKVMSECSIDLLILDVMLPNITGFEFAKKIKAQVKKTPIILLTALSEPDHRVEGLESGADDYMTKPFDPRELILRAKNLLELYKNNKNDQQEIIHIGFSTYNISTKKLSKQNQEIILSSTEQKLLGIFIAHKGRTLSREELSKKMGGLNDRSIDVQIVRLRQKIENDPKQPQYLLTIRHEGYALYI